MFVVRGLSQSHSFCKIRLFILILYFLEILYGGKDFAALFAYDCASSIITMK